MRPVRQPDQIVIRSYHLSSLTAPYILSELWLNREFVAHCDVVEYKEGLEAKLSGDGSLCVPDRLARLDRP